MTPTENPLFSGSCLCGAITFALGAPPLSCGHCHCDSCRRWQSAAFGTWTSFPTAAFTCQGTPQSYESSPGNIRQFCGACGSPLFMLCASDPDVIYATLASLTSSPSLRPTRHVSFEERAPWFAVNDGLPKFAGKDDLLPALGHNAGSIPVLTTERLILRAHRPEDFSACVVLWSEAAVTRYIGGKPSTPSQTWSRMLNYAGLWAFLGFGYWAVEERQSGALIGEVGFADFKRALEPAIAGLPEAGWVFMPAAHGKGYATEALRAATAWSDQNLSATRSVCLIDPLNEPSLRVAAKCGYRQIASTHYNDQPTLLLARSRPAVSP